MRSTAPSSRRKRQTRLNFTPLPSSSPAATHLSPQYRDRAAANTYDGHPSPLKRQRLRETNTQDPISDIDNNTASGKGDLQALPTPEPSSQLNTTELARNFGSGRTAQRALDFVDNDEDKFAQGKTGLNDAPPIRPRTRWRSPMFGSSDPEMVEFSSSSSSSEDLPSRAPARRSSRMIRNSMVKASVIDQTLGDISEAGTQIQISSRLRSARKVIDIELTVGNNQNFAESSVAASSKRKVTRRHPIAISSDETSISEDSRVQAEEEYSRSTNSFCNSKKSESETSSDEMPTSSPTKRPRRYPTRTVRKHLNSFEGGDDEVEDTEEDDSVSPRKMIKRSPREKLPNFEDEDEDEIVTTQRRRRPQVPNRRLSYQEKEDLDKDLQFLGSPERLPTKTRGKLGSPKQNARQKALEVLKRRRAGEKAELPVPDDQSRKAPTRGLYDTESNTDEDDETEVEEDNGNDYDRPRVSIRSADVLDMFQEDDEDEGFVVEDGEEEDTLGAPVQLPLQFSNVSRMKGQDLFKYAIEWMVQKKINPAFAINDEIYDLAFRKLDDEVKGLAGSKFTSSIWTSSFTKALKARPDIVLLELSKEFRAVTSPHCEACNRRTHPATWSIQFTGKPYHHSNLEELSDDEDDEEGNEVTYDSDGRSLPDEDVTYAVGQFCMRNAQMAHTLNHWRYHLNECVVDYLALEGYCAPHRIVERDNWSIKKRRDYANKVVDEMEEKGEIRRLHRDYRTQIDYALEAKGQKFKGRR